MVSVPVSRASTGIQVYCPAVLATSSFPAGSGTARGTAFGSSGKSMVCRILEVAGHAAATETMNKYESTQICLCGNDIDLVGALPCPSLAFT
jgi:hypothetical protein